MSLRALGWIGVLAVVLAAPVGMCQAQDKPAATAADWPALVKRFKEARVKVEALQKQFENAKAAEQVKIQEEAKGPINEINTVYPELRKLAPEVYKADPTNVDAAEIILEIEFQGNRYANAVKAADTLLAKDPKHQLALNLGGVSKFATQDFVGAKALFDKAQSENVLIGQLSNYAQNCEPYIAYWEAEKKIRAAEDAAEGDQQLPVVELDTTKGKVKILLLENEAPNTVANFVSLVEKKFYDGLQFHRVIPQFMAQGGCPNSRPGSGAPPGTGGPGYNIPCECYEPNARLHFMGSLSMAHAGKDTGGSQFFMTHLPTAHLNPNPAAGSGHTVFGRVIEGMDVVAGIQKGDTIKSAKVIRKRNHEYKPVTTPEGGPKAP